MTRTWRQIREDAKAAWHQEQSQEEHDRGVRWAKLGNHYTRRAAEELLRFCEAVGILALLFALRPASSGIDRYLVDALMAAMAFVAWLYCMNASPPIDPAPRTAAGWMTWRMLFRFVGAWLITGLVFFSSYRLGALAMEVQFGAKNPKPAPVETVAYKPAPKPNIKQPPAAKPLLQKRKDWVGPRD